MSDSPSTGTPSSIPTAALSAGIAVALGGAIGAVLRYALTVPFEGRQAEAWVTLGINVAGSFALTMLMLSAIPRAWNLWAPALGSGLLGGFTTFSAVSELTRSLVASGDVAAGGAYLLGTLAACWAGAELAWVWSSRSKPVGGEHS